MLPGWKVKATRRFLLRERASVSVLLHAASFPREPLPERYNQVKKEQGLEVPAVEQ
jgi:hypothetical protein